LYAKYFKDVELAVTIISRQIKKTLRLLTLALFTGGTLLATTFVANGGFITPQGKDDVKINLFYNQYTGRYDGAGNYSVFAAGETRLDYTVFFDLKYGTSPDSDVQITLPYINKSHTLPSGAVFTANGIGDLTFIGRKKSGENKNTDAMLTVGAGVKIPTGKSFFNIDKSSLATGTGTWDVGVVMNMQENNNGVFLFTDVSYWYRFGFNIQKFAGWDISAVKAGETEVKFSPGGIIRYNVGIEMPIIRQISILGELNGEVYYESKAAYLSNDTDAVNDLLSKGYPDFTLERTVNIRAIAGVKFYLGEKVALGGGVSIPVNIINSFGNITYIAHCRLFF